MTLAGPSSEASRRGTPSEPARRTLPPRSDAPAPSAISAPAERRRLDGDALSQVLARAVATRPPADLSLGASSALLHSGRTLARRKRASEARAPAKPKPIAAPQKYAHQTENPALLESIYPHRERALKKFVAMYREIELRDFTAEADRGTVVKRVIAEMDAEIERLKAQTSSSKAAAEQLKALERRKQRDEAAGDKAWEDAVAWEAEHRADPLAGKELQAEVDRLIASKAVPGWVGPMVRDYVGMRYKSAHGSYLSPVRLLYAVQQEAGAWEKARAAESAERDAAYERALGEYNAKAKKDRGRAPTKPREVKWSAAESAAVHLSPAAAVTRIEQMYQAGEIPSWAWHKIVRLTELRTRYATQGWEDTDEEVAGSTPVDLTWKRIMSAWEKDSGIAGADFNPGHGTTAWRQELNRRNALITTRMVCNELSEAALRNRGITLSGGISGDVKDFEKAQAEGEVGAYFKQLSSAADLRTGATLFFLNRDAWKEADEKGRPPEHALVRYVPGAVYPMPPPPEDVQEWSAWKSGKDKREAEIKAWEKAAKKGGAAAAKPEPYAVAEPHSDAPALVPANGTTLKGWLYKLVPGEAISRTKGGVTHWLGWKHQAQVLRVWPDGRVFTLETTVETVKEAGASKTIEYSGFRVHRLSEMIEHHAFVGYLPGNDTPAAPQSDAASAPAAPQPDAASAPAAQ